MLVVASGETPIRVEPVQAAELDLILKAYGWVVSAFFRQAKLPMKLYLNYSRPNRKGPIVTWNSSALSGLNT